MSNKELDEILNEIKQRSQSKEEYQGAENTISDDSPIEKAMDDVLKIINDDEITPEGNDFQNASANESSESLNILEMTEKEDDFMNSDMYNREFSEEEPSDKKKSKKPLIISVAVILIIAIIVGLYFGVFRKKDESPTTTAQKTTQATQQVNSDTNPLTGETDFNKAAIGKRPVAVVVENEYNTASVKPQWGINDADIVLEGESEYSTRLLLFWADFTDMPAQIGPARSARPPFIRFSQLFDCIFIHAGLSRTKGNYIGANTVFKNENIDHINLLSCGEDGTYFGRDKSRTRTIEHTGFFNGTSAPELIAKQNFNTDINPAKFSNLEFNKTPQALSDKAAASAKFVWSDVYSNGHCPKVGEYFYDETSEKYSTKDFDSDFGNANLEFENLIFLLDETEYVVKENYKNSGQSEIYCDYKLSGGTGAVLSQGTSLDITWGVENGKLWMKDKDGNSVKLNPGKSYIGYGSSNKGGSITIQ
ncbi:MAG: DUF3048 domain-containing protein [Eubacterium sp.]|nr:DUF3048 domain-containing protein [Eubacterium sp.]